MRIGTNAHLRSNPLNVPSRALDGMGGTRIGSKTSYVTISIVVLCPKMKYSFNISRISTQRNTDGKEQQV